jgi:hypothetical protein
LDSHLQITMMTRTKITPWTWNASREQAAQLIADNQISNDQIAARIGVTPKTVTLWKRESPEFRARIAEHVATFRKNITTTGLVLKENRIALLKARAATIRGMMLARGKQKCMRNAPGETVMQKGIQVRTQKSIGSGHFAEKVEEFAVDTAALAEERAILQQIATEMGDWKTKSQVEVAEGPSIVDILRDRRLRRLHCEQEDQDREAAEAAAQPVEPEMPKQLE